MQEDSLHDVAWAEAEQCPQGGWSYAHSAQRTSFVKWGLAPGLPAQLAGEMVMLKPSGREDGVGRAGGLRGWGWGLGTGGEWGLGTWGGVGLGTWG